MVLKYKDTHAVDNYKTIKIIYSMYRAGETSFRPEDHADWEMAPPSYDLQSWGSLGLNEHLRILYI